MIPSFIKKDKIPHRPGIYIYKSSKGEILYVGKAVDLYHRVSSYFSGASNSFKTAHMVEQIRDVETIIVKSELEALILEANLIKKYLPPYNIRLTDDKDYLYIGITREDFPRIITVRKSDLPALPVRQVGGRQVLKPIKEWFGPFPSSTIVKNTLRQLRRVFPWCSGMGHGSSIKGQVRSRACFYYHLGLCPGACVGKTGKEDYNRIIKRFSKFLSGRKEELIDELGSEMKMLADEQKFEEAAKIKKIIANIEYLTQPNRVTKYLENSNFLEQENISTIKQLQKDLNLAELPERIEAYDISNISGTNATGSMVVLTRGEIDKSQYRRFKIHISGKPNDFAMHAEMMFRRLNHLDWGLPQLILIDGGRGQVRAAQESIKYQVSSIKKKNEDLAQKLSSLPIYGIAKRFEWLYPAEGEVIKLPRRSLSLRLLQKIRDESHRFAVSYHRKLRSKSLGI